VLGWNAARSLEDMCDGVPGAGDRYLSQIMIIVKIIWEILTC